MQRPAKQPPLPPYGRRLLELRRAGIHGCNGFVRVALDWQLFPGRGWRVVIPPGRQPDEFFLAPLVAGLDVHVLHFLGDELRATDAVQEILPFCRSLARLAFDDPMLPAVEFDVVRSALAPASGIAA